MNLQRTNRRSSNAVRTGHRKPEPCTRCQMPFLRHRPSFNYSPPFSSQHNYQRCRYYCNQRARGSWLLRFTLFSARELLLRRQRVITLPRNSLSASTPLSRRSFRFSNLAIPGPLFPILLLDNSPKSNKCRVCGVFQRSGLNYQASRERRISLPIRARSVELIRSLLIYTTKATTFPSNHRNNPRRRSTTQMCLRLPSIDRKNGE